VILVIGVVIADDTTVCVECEIHWFVLCME
jgi:hypothetical protein